MQKKKLLIVDDDPLILDLYSDFFTQQNFKVKTAQTVDKALQIIQKERPDVILSDVVMPDKNGFDLYETIKRLKKKIPFIFMTGYELDPQVSQKLKELDVPWISKPTKLETLLKLVREQLAG